MSALDINGIIGLGQIAVVFLAAGVFSERLKNTKERQKEDRESYTAALDKHRTEVKEDIATAKLDAVNAARAGDTTTAAVMDRMVSEMHGLRADLKEALTGLRGVAEKVAEHEGHIRATRPPGQSTPRMPAVGDRR